jgi:hypothetical protein
MLIGNEVPGAPARRIALQVDSSIRGLTRRFLGSSPCSEPASLTCAVFKGSNLATEIVRNFRTTHVATSTLQALN